MIQTLKRKFIKLITRFYDPIVILNVGNQKLKIPLSHQLSNILKLYPEYNFNLARIVHYVSMSLSDLKVIDIGANIGDSVAFIRNFADVPILCIDGEPKFFRILKENTKHFNNVFSVQALLGDENKDVNLRLKSTKGTAYIAKGNQATSMRTLEDILKDFPQFQRSKIIKCDTDGFDSIILRSCRAYLESIRPILFFEFDPHLIKKNNDDAFEFMSFLQECGYRYFIFYTNIGEYLISCSSDENVTIEQLIHYFSGRKLDLYADVCAFTDEDKQLFDSITKQEIAHFRQIRNY